MSCRFCGFAQWVVGFVNRGMPKECASTGSFCQLEKQPHLVQQRDLDVVRGPR
jgi:hypothetical protein